MEAWPIPYTWLELGPQRQNIRFFCLARGKHEPPKKAKKKEENQGNELWGSFLRNQGHPLAPPARDLAELGPPASSPSPVSPPGATCRFWNSALPFFWMLVPPEKRPPLFFFGGGRGRHLCFLFLDLLTPRRQPLFWCGGGGDFRICPFVLEVVHPPFWVVLKGHLKDNHPLLCLFWGGPLKQDTPCSSLGNHQRPKGNGWLLTAFCKSQASHHARKIFSFFPLGL